MKKMNLLILTAGLVAMSLGVEAARRTEPVKDPVNITVTPKIESMYSIELVAIPVNIIVCAENEPTLFSASVKVNDLAGYAVDSEGGPDGWRVRTRSCSVVLSHKTPLILEKIYLLNCSIRQC